MNRAATVRACRPPQARLSVVKQDRFLTGAARIKLFIHALSATSDSKRDRYLPRLVGRARAVIRDVFPKYRPITNGCGPGDRGRFGGGPTSSVSYVR